MQQPLQAAGASGDPGGTTSISGSPALADQPTVHEFVTQLVTSAEARQAFDADPHAALNHAGLGDLTPTDVLHAMSLVLDYAPVEVIEAYNLSLQSSVAKFAASTQHVAIDTLHPAQSHEQEATEHSMMESTPSASSFSKSGDADKHMNMQMKISEHDSHDFISIHDIASHNTVDAVSMAASASSAASSVSESFDHTVDVANGLIHDFGAGMPSGNEIFDKVESTLSTAMQSPASLPVVGTVVGAAASMAPAMHLDPASGLAGVPVIGAVAAAASAGDLTGALPNLPAASDVTGALANVPVAGSVVGAVAGAAEGGLPAGGDVTGALANVPVAGSVVGAVAGAIEGGLPAGGDVTGALANVPIAGDVAGHLAGALPNLPAAGDLTGALANVPVAGDVAGAVAGAVPTGGLPAAGAVTAHVSAVTEHVTSTVHSLPVVSQVANTLPMPDVHAVPVVGDVASGLVSEAHALPVVGDVTSALPLDHGL